ncbi:hypothetical protein F8388_008116 [Cannabis sativa]|uniref:Cytochrome P450 n=1 Tax=Cannabis sativa TaxID=3483 RepID=A0A7J6EUX4_CANSA|nr:hypothetical protein F8388_008116 [Cannabis sativa]
MDLQLLSFPIISLVFMFMVVKIVLKRAHHQAKNSVSKLPPGPWKLPLVGNIHQIFGSSPHISFRDLAKIYGPFMYLKIGQIPTLIVSSPEYVKEIMRTHDVVFASRPQTLAAQIMAYNCTDIIFSSYGEHWRQLRKISMQELLSPGRVQTFRPVREEELCNLVEGIMTSSKDGSPINVTKMVTKCSYGITSRAAFGKKSSDHDEFISIVEEAIEAAGGFEFAEVFPALRFLDWKSRPIFESIKLRSSRIMENIIKEHIKEKEISFEKIGKDEDLVDVLLKFHKNGDDLGRFTLTKDNIKAVIFDIFVAGSETTSLSVDWAMVEMMRFPKVMKKAQEEVRKIIGTKGSVNESLINEMKYLKLVVKETLRLHPPAPLLLPRESTEKCDIYGYEIPKKTRVIVNAWAIGRDPKYWIEPENFMPERFMESSIDFKGNNFEYIPFGGGRRICPGMLFGVINIGLSLAYLLYHFDWKLPNGMNHENLDMTELFALIYSSPIITVYMEFQQIPSFQVLLFSVFMFIVVSILLKRAQTSNNSASKLPPGPWRLPFLGNLHQLLGPFPHHTLRDLAQKHGPFMYLKIGQVPTIVVSSPEYAKEVMKTHDISFASRPKTLVAKTVSYDSTDILFAPYGEYWRELRKICLQELLSPSRVKAFQPIREEESFNIVKLIASKVGSLINLSEMTRRLSYNIISRAAFGNKSSDHDEFISIMEEIVKLSGGFAFGDVFPSLSYLDWYTLSKFNHYKQRASRIVERIIKLHTDQDKEIKSSTKKSGEEEDLVDVLLKFYKSEDHHKFTLTRDNLKAVIFNIFGAGSDTSATTIDWAMAELMRNPRVMKKAQDEVRQVFREKGLVNESSINEMKYLKSVVKETLRLHPPAALLIPRESREKCEINGYEIPTKTRIIVNAWAIGRDPKYWIEPESFMPERFVDSAIDFKGNNFEYIPFGAGRRICPGISFGLINVELPLALLLYHFDWNLPNGMKNEHLDMTERFGLAICRKKDLYVIPSKYDPPSMVKA